MNLKLFSVSLIVIVFSATFIAAHGHSHDEHDHHHSHEEDVNPSFKYSRQANEQINKQANHASHDHNGHSHDESHHDHFHGEKPKTKDVSAG